MAWWNANWWGGGGSSGSGGGEFPGPALGGSMLGSNLLQILLADDIEPGADPSYQICKALLLYHPLGQKMAEAPVVMAQSQQREITVQGAPDRVVEAFKDEAKKINDLGIDKIARNHVNISRAYGIGTLALLVEGQSNKSALDLWKLGDRERGLSFNVFDPLNTAGSLVLNQQPNAMDFLKPRGPVVVGGQTYHRSHVRVLMHESPIYIAYTTSAFGFSGRSVFQRALYPMKTFIQSMITDDMITRKAGLLIAKMKQPGPVVNQLMQNQMALKRDLLKSGQTNQVLGIGTEEDIETLNMMNIDGAAGFARTNVLKNIATSADMPAFFLENETLVSGFGEGEEDARNIARYVDSVREEMCPVYDFLDEVCMYRAWNPTFYKSIQRLYPQQYENVEYQTAFMDWRTGFKASWPSLLIEPDSERVKTDDVKLKAAIALAQVLLELPMVDPANKIEVLRFLQDAINESTMLFPNGMNLDFEQLMEFAEQQQEQQQQQQQMGMGAGGEGGQQGPPPPAPPFSMRDAQRLAASLSASNGVRQRASNLLELVRDG